MRARGAGWSVAERSGVCGGYSLVKEDGDAQGSDRGGRERNRDRSTGTRERTRQLPLRQDGFQAPCGPCVQGRGRLRQPATGGLALQRVLSVRWRVTPSVRV